MLEAKALTKIFSSGTAVNNVDITLNAGSISGLLGRNGAGKTTLFKILCGLITPDQGIVNITSRQKKSIGAVIEHPGLYDYLNAYENLRVFAKIQGAPHDRKSIETYLLKVGLPTEREDTVNKFSMGMRQRLGIAIALLNDPDILILDEPFSGLDPTGVKDLIDLIKNFAASGMAILLSSHLMAELQKSCDYLYVIEQGAIVNSGMTDDLIKRSVTLFTISAKGISKAESIKPFLLSIRGQEATVQCKQGEISNLLKTLIYEGFEIISCVPNITLDELLKRTS